MIQAAVHQPPDSTLVPALMDRVMEKLAQPGDMSTVLRGAWAHWAIARIHPFHDGNGRMARLWQDLVLLQGNLSCAIICPEDRSQYLEALGQADEGKFNPLVQLVAQRLAITLEKYVTQLSRERELVEGIKELVGEADARLQERRKLSYMRWSRRMEQLRWEFELCASRITDASDDIKVQVRPYDLIDQARWENIRSGLGAERTWFFLVDFSRQWTRWRYYFCFGRHFWSEQDTEHDRSEQRVCLLISEDDGTGEAKRLDQMEHCSITLREIFLVDDSFVCKRADPRTDRLDYDRNASPLQIALNFMRDVVLRRLT